MKLFPQARCKPLATWKVALLRRFWFRKGSWSKPVHRSFGCRKQQRPAISKRCATGCSFLELEERRLRAGSSILTNEAGSSPTIDFSEAQQAAREAQQQAFAQEQQALQARINEKQAELTSIVQRLALQETQVEIEQEKFAIQESLFDQGYTSKRRFLDAKSSLQNAQALLSELTGFEGRAQAQLAEAQAGLARSKAKAEEELAEERSRVTQERDELVFEAQKQRDRFDRLFVRAPVGGHIKALGLKGAGSVLAPGDVVAEIVPANSELVAEVRISPRDIGHVELGDQAEIAITTFDPNIQGHFDWGGICYLRVKLSR